MRVRERKNMISNGMIFALIVNVLFHLGSENKKFKLSITLVNKVMKKIVLTTLLFSIIQAVNAQSYFIYDQNYQYGLTPKTDYKTKPLWWI